MRKILRHAEGLADIRGGRPLRLTHDMSVDHNPAWSPDGMYLGFSSDLSGSQQIWVAPVAAGRALTIDVGGQVTGCVMFAGSYQSFPEGFLANRLDSMAMGGMEKSDFGRRLAAYPAAARKTELFNDKQDKYSSYGRCGDCVHLATCSVCPVSIGHIPGNTDPRRIPDFICAYNLVIHKYRSLFPSQPDALSILRGQSAVPDAMRKILGMAESLPGGAM